MPKVTSVKSTPSTPSGVLDRIKPMGFDKDDGIRILLYGKSGTGKTTLWATFPGKILALTCSGGGKPGELRSIDTAEYRKKVDEVNILRSVEITDVVDALEDGSLKGYKTLVLDHCTGLQDMSLAEILGMSEIPTIKNWGLADLKEYGQCSLQCQEHLRRMFRLKMNVVIITQERVHKEEGRDSELMRPTVGAGLMGSLATYLHSNADYVGQTFLREREVTTFTEVGDEKIETTMKVPGEVEYCLRVGPHPIFYTKFRKPKQQVQAGMRASVIVDPDYDKIMKVIRNL